MHSSLIGKIEKAKRYAQETGRVSFSNFTATFRGEHSKYSLSFRDGVWRCDCDFFRGWGRCSHTMAMERILDGMLPAVAEA